MKKLYEKPDVEKVEFGIKEELMDTIIDGSMGVGDSEDGWE